MKGEPVAVGAAFATVVAYLITLIGLPQEVTTALVVLIVAGVSWVVRSLVEPLVKQRLRP